MILNGLYRRLIATKPQQCFMQPRPQAFMRYRVTEGGLEPSAIVLGELFPRASRMTSHLITHRLRLGTRLCFMMLNPALTKTIRR